jgi:hypothetical protein
MKQYTILAESITGLKGKLLFKDEIHPETEFVAGHCPDLEAQCFIAEAKEEDAPKMIDHVVTQEDIDANPDLVTEGITVGQTIQIPEPPKKKKK